MEFQEYPKWIYPEGDVSRGYVVQSAEEETARDTADSSQAGAVDPVRAQLDAAGITYDQRWGLKRLKALLPE